MENFIMFCTECGSSNVILNQVESEIENDYEIIVVCGSCGVSEEVY